MKLEQLDWKFFCIVRFVKKSTTFSFLVWTLVFSILNYIFNQHRNFETFYYSNFYGCNQIMVDDTHNRTKNKEANGKASEAFKSNLPRWSEPLRGLKIGNLKKEEREFQKVIYVFVTTRRWRKFAHCRRCRRGKLWTSSVCRCSTFLQSQST